MKVCLLLRQEKQEELNHLDEEDHIWNYSFEYE